MRGLLNRLASIDSSAERGLRVIEFFDELVTHRADAEAITRATAILAETTAGVIFDGVGEIHVIDPDGRTVGTSGPGLNDLISEIVVDGETAGRTWLERRSATDGHEWDELIIARMALAMATLHARAYSDDTQLGLTNPAVLHTLLQENRSEAETARAARLLGFQVGQRVRVLAVSSDGRVEAVLPALRTAVATSTSSRTVAAAMTNSLAVLITAGDGDTRTPIPPGIAVCVGPEVAVERCVDSWSQAHRGIRFAAMRGALSRWITSDELGCTIALADLDSTSVAALPDVRAIDRLAHGRTRATDLELLDSLGRLGSVARVRRGPAHASQQRCLSDRQHLRCPRIRYPILGWALPRSNRAAAVAVACQPARSADLTSRPRPVARVRQCISGRAEPRTIARDYVVSRSS